MEASLSVPKLYRSSWRAVISIAVALILLQAGFAQVSAKKKKGPRAIGLLQLAPNGKGHLIPVAILIDGQYYDAASYKANPVPMALESGTVYEAISTGVSQGLFTVAGAVQANNTWLGEGTWQAAGSAPAKKAATPSRKPDEDVDAPPVLRRSGATPVTPPAEPPVEAKPDTQVEKKEETPPPPAEAAPSEDADRPVLRRGKQEEPTEKPAKPEITSTKPPSAVTQAAPASIKVIPAISDADVQEPRSFDYKMKPEEDEQLRKKMLAMASDEVNARVKMPGAGGAETSTAGHPVRAKGAAKPVMPVFDDIQMRVFDLTSNNEPVLVLTATAHSKSTNSAADIPFFVTLVARNNIYGELKKVSANITDPQHLDVVPQMQLIDAVDADGDGRGELVFRRASDIASAYAIYRVIGTQLYPLFEGKL